MKTILTAALVIILFEFHGYSQRLYSQENLIRATQDDLNFYLSKAQSQKKTGAVLLILSPASLITGSLLTKYSWSGGSYFLGLGMMLSSIPFAAVGLPVWTVGRSRVKAISEIINSRFPSARIDISACCFNNFHTQNNQPGISIRINF